jgi:hypothetical protein
MPTAARAPADRYAACEIAHKKETTMYNLSGKTALVAGDTIHVGGGSKL